MTQILILFLTLGGASTIEVYEVAADRCDQLGSVAVAAGDATKYSCA